MRRLLPKFGCCAVLSWLVLTAANHAQTISPETGQGVAGTYTHRPRGASANGSTNATKDALTGVVKFVFNGGPSDETIEYTIATESAEVNAGKIVISASVNPAQSQIVVADGGLMWRNSSGALETPANQAAASTVTRFHNSLSGNILTMRFYEVRNGTSYAGLKTYTYWMEGKVLRVRAVADRSFNASYLNNYGGFTLGVAPQLSDQKDQQIPYMDSCPVTVFTANGSTRNFRATYLDHYRSNGSGTIVSNFNAQGSEAADPGVFFGVEYFKDSNGQVLAQVDETLNVIVTSKIRETFPVVQHAQSPYFDLTKDRMTVLASGIYPRAWYRHKQHLEKLSDLGVENLQGIVWHWEKYGNELLDIDRDTANPMGCDPATIKVDPTPYVVPNPLSEYPTKIYRATVSDNKLVADLEFGALMQLCKQKGLLFGLYTDSANIDENLGPTAYPTNIGPLWFESWYKVPLGQTLVVPTTSGGTVTLLAGEAIGLDLPTGNAFYDGSKVVRDDLGQPKLGWNTVYNLPHSTWDGYGHGLHNFSAAQMYDLLTDRLENLPASYDPGAAFVDQTCDLPGNHHIDQMVGSNRSHTIADFLVDRNDAMLRHRRDMEGPLFGEGTYWRSHQFETYDSGIWDGRHRTIPRLVKPQGPTVPLGATKEAPIIPDYEHFEVAGIAGANYGMGWEGQFDPSAPTPYDGTNGLNSSFADQWFTTIATYGHSAFLGTNGHVSNTFWTMEGTLRSYYLLTGLHAAQRSTTVTAVEYESGGNYYDLSATFAAGITFDTPRIRISYANGLKLWANHAAVGGSVWQVQNVGYRLNGVGTPTTVTFHIPPKGFVATDGEKLLVFSAPLPNSTTGRIDYARVPGKWRMISCRGTATSFEGFPNPSEQIPSTANWTNFLAHTVVRNYTKDVLIGASGGLWNPSTESFASGAYEIINPPQAALPSALTLQVQSQQTSVDVDREIGISALATYGNDPQNNAEIRNVTPLVTWSSSHPSLASVNKVGVVLGKATGQQVTISATWDPDGAGPAAALTALVNLNVVEGKPIANAGLDATIAVGMSYDHTGSASSDSQSPVLAYRWTFDDGSPDAYGAKVVHTYHTPGVHTTTLTVTDREGHVSLPDTVQITVTGTNMFRESFSGAVFEGWSFDPTKATWGLMSGAAYQAQTGTGYHALKLDGSTFSAQTMEVTLALGGAAGATPRSGIHFRKSHPSHEPPHSGYFASLSPGGVVTLFEGTGTTAVPRASFTISGMPNGVHTMKIQLVQTVIPTVTLNIKVFIDGTQRINWTDNSVVQPGGLVAFMAQDQSASFDDFIVY